MKLVEREFLNFISANKNIHNGHLIINLITKRIIALFNKDKDYNSNYEDDTFEVVAD
jgi:hypothetical protein